ncbi:GNAT family N-acetyltransferase [Sphaerisporangium rufum]|uniref:GNAT family N-acetyltransferase n=1 Tax=Sphaerisporangium rufum TaxID=1381558 RepID=UPI00194E78B6|nr:GNAT family N-acetyltransferase [Sphaerisporangium rufum]
MDLDTRIALVARTWTPTQQLHPGNVAWHGSGCDGAPPADVTLAGDGWFAELWQEKDSTQIWGHFSPDLSSAERDIAFDRIRAHAPRGSISVVTGAPMADTLRAAGAQEVDRPFFLLQHRDLGRLPSRAPAAGYTIVTAEEAGEAARVDAHRRAWAPARIKELLGLPVTGDEPLSGFTLDRYRTMKAVSIYRPELDLVVLAPDGGPAAFALGWLDDRSRSVLFEPVGTSPGHARRGLAQAVCVAVLSRARELGAVQAVVGPRGDDAYPAPRRLYGALGFVTLARTRTLAWRA